MSRACGLLAEAGGRAEGEHLVALGGRRAVGEDEQARLGMRAVQAVHVGRRAQRAEVEDRDASGAARARTCCESLDSMSLATQLEVVVLVDERAQPTADEVLEAARRRR